MSSFRVRPFEDVMLAELAGLVRADVPARAIRLTVREAVVARMEGGPLGAREVTDAMEAAVRAACRLVREMGAPDEVVETVCRGALEAVRGHGGTSARWLPEATSAAHAVLDQLALERPPHPAWQAIAWRLSRW